MSNYANESVFVFNKTTEIESVFVTARTDFRTEKALAIEVPRYFGPEFVFTRKQVHETGLTKEQAELGRQTLLTYYGAVNRHILNVRDSALALVA
jgi:hypothetical protein